MYDFNIRMVLIRAPGVGECFKRWLGDDKRRFVQLVTRIAVVRIRMTPGRGLLLRVPKPNATFKVFESQIPNFACYQSILNFL
jgi:hypothetical protein